jgi:hypothetical protein
MSDPGSGGTGSHSCKRPGSCRRWVCSVFDNSSPPPPAAAIIAAAADTLEGTKKSGITPKRKQKLLAKLRKEAVATAAKK